MAGDFDRTAIDLQQMARRVDIKLLADPDTRPDYEQYADKITDTFSKYKNRAGRLPSTFSPRVDQLGELPNLSLLQFFKEEEEPPLSASQPIHQCEHESAVISAEPSSSSSSSADSVVINMSGGSGSSSGSSGNGKGLKSHHLSGITDQDRLLMKRLHTQLHRLHRV